MFSESNFLNLARSRSGLKSKTHEVATVLLILALASLACAGPIQAHNAEVPKELHHPYLNLDYRIDFSDKGSVRPERKSLVKKVLDLSGLKYHSEDDLATVDKEYTYYEAVDPETGEIVLEGRAWGQTSSTAWGILHKPGYANDVVFEVTDGSGSRSRLNLQACRALAILLMMSLASLACAVPILEALHEYSTISCHNGLPKNVDFRVEFEEVEGRVDDNRGLWLAYYPIFFCWSKAIIDIDTKNSALLPMMFPLAVSDCSRSRSSGFRLKAYVLAILLVLGLASLACAGPIKARDEDDSSMALAEYDKLRLEFPHGGEVIDKRKRYVYKLLELAGIKCSEGQWGRNAKIDNGGYTYFWIADGKSSKRVLGGKVWGHSVDEPWGLLYKPEDEEQVIFELHGNVVTDEKAKDRVKEYLEAQLASLRHLEGH
ncbi:hypothetical protein EV360DRAFT_79560 [Lentinula raphanica]|nr:hypothetical protein EV360DRAFT_79560 [Lentinula raphanica]